MNPEENGILNPQAVNATDSAPVESNAVGEGSAPQEVSESEPQPPVEQGSEPTGKVEGTPEPPKPSEYQKLRRRAQEAEQEAAYLRSQMQVNPINKPQETNVVSNELKEPNIMEFDDPNDYEKAQREYYVQLAKREFKEELVKEKTEQEQAIKNQAFNQKLNELRFTDPDKFNKVTYLPVDTQSELGQEIIASDVGLDVAAYFADNPSELFRFQNMPEKVMLKQLGVLESKITNKPKPKNQISTAPAPVNPVNTSSPSGNKNPLNMDSDEWNKYMGRG